MKGLELTLVFREDMAFLTNEVALDFNQVDFSEYEAKFNGPAYWKIRVINHNVSERKLFVEVLSYHVGETAFPNYQVQMAEDLVDIERIGFRNIDTTGFLRTLQGAKLSKLKHPVKEGTFNLSSYNPQPVVEVRKPVKQNYTEPFVVRIKQLTFGKGVVTFSCKLPILSRPVQFSIENEHVTEEMDAVKNYFASVLKTKTIKVIPDVEFTDGQVTSIKAHSDEINGIDNTLIEEVKFCIIKKARSRESISEKQLFTAEEYIETYVADIAGSKELFGKTDLLNLLMERTKTKHYNQLGYLSKKHRHDIQKLRFVHDPFSFVFLLQGNGRFHLVWETLDTKEATYIWSLPDDKAILGKSITALDRNIRFVKEEGKNRYINLREEDFTRIKHDYTDPENVMRDWKTEIEKIVFGS